MSVAPFVTREIVPHLGATLRSHRRPEFRVSASMVDITHYLNDCKFILVSNREPYEHVRGVHGIEVKQPAGGLVSALDPTMRRTHGTRVAGGPASGAHEVADEPGRVAVPPPPDEPS